MKDRVTFLDYVMGGCQIKVSVAIDFTGSNGDMKDPACLHYMPNRDHNNDYTEAINAVVSILESYCHEKQFPVYGFGASLKELKEISHCFAMNGNIYAPECNGVQGVLDAYYSTLQKAHLGFGGTRFDKILEYVNQHAEVMSQEIN